MENNTPAVLVLEDGTTFHGKAIGKIGTTTGEIAFNTGMTGYQEVFTDPSLHFNTIPKETWNPHYLYHLGTAIKPTREVKAGEKIVRSMRVWAMLDLLLTSETIQDARDKSQVRLKHSQ